MKINIVLGILLFLTIIVILIYLNNQNVKLEYFENPNVSTKPNTKPNTTQKPVQKSISFLPETDIHFILDNTVNLIETPVFNYKIKTNNTNTAIPTNTYIDKFTDTDTDTDTPTSTNPYVYLSVFHHKEFANTYNSLGQYVKISNVPLDKDVALKDASNIKAVSILTSSTFNPLRYDLIWTSDINQDGEIFSIWHPIAPPGTVALGDIIVLGTDTPALNYVKCIPTTMLSPIHISNGILWSATNDMGRQCFCWGATNINLFRATLQYNDTMPELSTVYNLPPEFLKQNILLSSDEKNGKGVRV